MTKRNPWAIPRDRASIMRDADGRAYRVDGTALTGDAPLAVSYNKGSQMLVVIRGTVYAREWQRDFQYRWAKAKGSVRGLFPRDSR